MTALPLFTRRGMLAGAAATPVLGGSVFAQAKPTPRLTDFGGIGDGRVDNAQALRAAFSFVGPNGTLAIPAGRFLVLDRTIRGGAPPFVIPQGVTLMGEGPRSVLSFRRELMPSFYGLTVSESGVTVRDLTLEVDTAGSGWTAAVGITAAIRKLRFSKVVFVGTGTRTGHQGILPLNADIDGLTADGCRFERLDFGFTRQTTDTAVHRGLLFSDCTGENCTEVFEINAPGLLFVETHAGSNVIQQVFDEAGRPISPDHLEQGQEVRSAAFAPGTVISGRDSAGRLRTSKPAVANASKDNPARLSAGGASGGVVRNLTVRNIGQWAVGLSNCTDWDVDVQGQEVGYELVHVEDGSQDIRIRAGGVRCNLEPGVVGSPGAENGMVHISTGSRNISVVLDTADLTQNMEGHPAALCVQAGGRMGTTGREVTPRGIIVGGRILLRSGCRGVVAFDSDLRFDNLELFNIDRTRRADPVMRLPGCILEGVVKVHNPGRELIQEEANRFRGNLKIDEI